MFPFKTESGQHFTKHAKIADSISLSFVTFCSGGIVKTATTFWEINYHNCYILSDFPN